MVIAGQNGVAECGSEMTGAGEKSQRASDRQDENVSEKVGMWLKGGQGKGFAFYRVSTAQARV